MKIIAPHIRQRESVCITLCDTRGTIASGIRPSACDMRNMIYSYFTNFEREKENGSNDRLLQSISPFHCVDAISLIAADMVFSTAQIARMVYALCHCKSIFNTLPFIISIRSTDTHRAGERDMNQTRRMDACICVERALPVNANNQRNQFILLLWFSVLFPSLFCAFFQFILVCLVPPCC